LPIEGTLASIPRAGDVARKDAPTCRLDERLGDVKDRVRGAGWEVCVVTNEQRVVMGLLRSKELDRDEELTIERAMRPGPSTFRPHVEITEMADYMGRHGLESSPVTTPDGRLVGILLREDAERATHELHQAAHELDDVETSNP
jgi:predicted transcriptional regulator